MHRILQREDTLRHTDDQHTRAPSAPQPRPPPMAPPETPSKARRGGSGHRISTSAVSTTSQASERVLPSASGRESPSTSSGPSSALVSASTTTSASVSRPAAGDGVPPLGVSKTERQAAIRRYLAARESAASLGEHEK